MTPAVVTPAVVTHDVVKRYGREAAVDGLSLRVERGVIVGLIGPSGSGKTTTVRLLTGLERPTEGTVRVMDAEPVAFTADERARIGFMPQQSVLYPHLTLTQNLRFAAALYGLSGRRRRQRIREVLDLVELREHRGKQLHTTSGGMQRRLALASALVHDPELLFLDEPTAGLDPVLRRTLWGHLRDLRSAGRTLLVTTQYVGEAGYCDIVVVLRAGRVLAAESPGELRRLAFGGDLVDLVTNTVLSEGLAFSAEQEPYVRSVTLNRTDGRGLRLAVDDAERALPRLRAWSDAHGLRIDDLREHVADFDDVFVTLVRDRGDA